MQSSRLWPSLKSDPQGLRSTRNVGKKAVLKEVSDTCHPDGEIKRISFANRWDLEHVHRVSVHAEGKTTQDALHWDAAIAMLDKANDPQHERTKTRNHLVEWRQDRKHGQDRARWKRTAQLIREKTFASGNPGPTVPESEKSEEAQTPPPWKTSAARGHCANFPRIHRRRSQDMDISFLFKLMDSAKLAVE